MSAERLPKYNPDGTFIRLDQVPVGHYAKIFIIGGGHVSSADVVVAEHIKTKQDRNPMVKTTKGQILGGGTSVKLNVYK